MTPAQAKLYAKCAAALHTGFWFCRACASITEAKHQGEHNQCCELCGSRGIYWTPPTITASEEKELLTNPK